MPSASTGDWNKDEQAVPGRLLFQGPCIGRAGFQHRQCFSRRAFELLGAARLATGRDRRCLPQGQAASSQFSSFRRLRQGRPAGR